MSWHTRYNDTILEDPALEQVIGFNLPDKSSHSFPIEGITIGGFGQASATQVAVWRRLIESALSVRPRELWFGCDTEFLSNLLPRSIHDQIFVATDRDWSPIQPRGGNLSFALVQTKAGKRLLFLGLPTEEGLDILTSFVSN